MHARSEMTRTPRLARLTALVTTLLLAVLGLSVPTAAQAASTYTVSGKITFPASAPSSVKQPINWSEPDYMNRGGVYLTLYKDQPGSSVGWELGTDDNVSYNPSTGAWAISGVPNGTYRLSVNVWLPKNGGVPGTSEKLTVNGKNVSAATTAIKEKAQLRPSIGSCVRSGDWAVSYAKNMSTGTSYQLEPQQSGWVQMEPRCVDGNDESKTSYGNYGIPDHAPAGTYTIYAEQNGTREYYTSEGRGSTKAADAARLEVKLWEGNTPQMLIGTKGPKISGTAAVGNKLTVNRGTWAPEAVPTLKYQWKLNGVAISGATRTTYTPTAADLGKKLTVTVSGKLADAEGLNVYSGAMTSAAATVDRGTLKTAKPKISGTTKVGKTLKLSRGSWTSGTSFTYRWYRSGKAISGATQTSYKLKSADAGKKITVKVTGKKSGYTTASRTSSSTAKIAKR
ncbi:MAG: hypothetical protein ACK5LO_01040 [Leucobacter sp.]